MGTKANILPGGILWPQRATAATIAAQGASPLSSFSKATPRPGLPVADDAWSRLQIEVSHAQGTDLDVHAIKAGQPARDGVQLAYKKDSEAATAWRGWNGPQACMSWVPLVYAVGGTDIYDRYDSVTVPSSQVVLSWYRIPGTEALKPISTGVDLSTSLSAAFISGTGTWAYPATFILPGSERIVVVYGGVAYYTDDLGVTISTWATEITLESTTNYGHTQITEYRGDLIMLVEDTATANTVHHLVSTDLGATYQLVQSYAALGDSVTTIATEDGIMVAYIAAATGFPSLRKLGSVFEELDAVTATEIKTGGGADRSCGISADENGTLYVLSGGDEISTVYESLDAGESWRVYNCASIRFGSNADAIERPRAVWALGQMMTVARQSDNGVSVAERLGMFVLGGWSTETLTADNGTPAYPWDRWGFGARVGSTGADGETWFPNILPQNQGWTLGGAVVPAQNAEGSVSITTTGANTASLSNIFTNHVGHCILAELKVVSGGSSSRDVAVVGRMADNVYDYEWELVFNTTTMVFNDLHAATTTSVAIDFTAFVQLLIVADKGTIKVWHRSAGETVWTEDVDAALVDGGAGTASGIIEWGNLNAASAVSHWRQFHFATATANPPIVGDDLATIVGKSFNARPSAIPEMSDAAADVAYLAAVAGPARTGDAFDVDAFYEHDIANAHVEVSPSPASKWRSTDTTEQAIVYDLGESGWAGHSIALFVAGANFKTSYLESYNGATWDTRATLDLSDGFAGLTPGFTGDMVQPGGGADGGRWLWEEELRGGWVQATTGATSATRILAQSSGGWTSSTTVSPTIRVEDSTQLTGATVVSLVWATGCVVWHPATAAQTMSRYWRVRIPAGTAGDDTPDGEAFFEAGVIGIMRVQPFGAEVSWGKGMASTSNTEKTRDAYGTTRARKRGPATRRWTMGWPDPTDLTQLRLGPDGDYVAGSTGQPLAGAKDVYHLLRGLQVSTDGGAIPVVGLEMVPATSGTVITDPSLFLYGTLSADVRANQNTGTEVGRNESLRVESISIDEIP